MNTMSSHHCSWPLRVLNLEKGSNKFSSLGSCGHYSPSRVLGFTDVGYLPHHKGYQSERKCGPIFCSSVSDNMNPNDPDDIHKNKSHNGEIGGVNNELFRENLEKISGMDDSKFTGFELATLIRNKYGRSYDVQLVKKEFMGRNLFALNVMWKYMEQKKSTF